MKANRTNDNERDPHGEEGDPLWQLLGESPRSEPDAWFTVRTLARCRHAGLSREAGWEFSFGGLWRWALGGGLGICLAVVLMMGQVPDESTVPPKQAKVEDAFEILAAIDSSDADSSSSSSSWQDSSL